MADIEEGTLLAVGDQLEKSSPKKKKKKKKEEAMANAEVDLTPPVVDPPPDATDDDAPPKKKKKKKKKIAEEQAVGPGEAEQDQALEAESATEKPRKKKKKKTGTTEDISESNAAEPDPVPDTMVPTEITETGDNNSPTLTLTQSPRQTKKKKTSKTEGSRDSAAVGELNIGNEAVASVAEPQLVATNSRSRTVDASKADTSMRAAKKSAKAGLSSKTGPVKPGAFAANSGATSTSNAATSNKPGAQPATGESQTSSGKRGSAGTVQASRASFADSSGGPDRLVQRERNGEVDAIVEEEALKLPGAHQEVSVASSSMERVKSTRRSKSPKRSKQSNSNSAPIADPSSLSIAPVSIEGAIGSSKRKGLRKNRPSDNAIDLEAPPPPTPGRNQLTPGSQDSKRSLGDNTSEHSQKQFRPSQNLIEAVLVVEKDEPSQQMEILNAVQVDPDEDPNNKPIYEHRQFKFWMGGICCVLVLIIIIVVATQAAGGGGKSDAENGAPTMSPTTMAPTGVSPFYSDIQERVQSFLIDPTQLQNTTSPYYKALRWLIYTDDTNPTDPSFDPEQMQQRYLLALFYYSTSEGDAWRSCSPVDTGEAFCMHLEYDKEISDKDGEPQFQEIPSSRWLSDTPECGWAGLHCDGSKNIGKIQLAHYNLKGSIPAEFGLFSNLGDLNFQSKDNSEYRLVGTIPTIFGTMANLGKILMSENLFSSTLPPELCNATRLDLLELSTNRLQGTLPTCLGQLTELEKLGLSDNGFVGTIPTELGSIATLEEVELHKNSLTGTVPPGRLCNLPKREIKVDCPDEVECGADCNCRC